MKTLRQRLVLSHAVLGLLLAAATGCQTNIAGMTLPSGHYLQHPPQYFPESPPYPLTRELASMEAAAAGQAPGPAAPPAAPVPAAPEVLPPGR